MRAFISFFVALCLFVAAFGAMKQGPRYELGKRKNGDYLVLDKVFIQPPGLPWKETTMLLRAQAPKPNDVLNYFLIDSMNGNSLIYMKVYGDINTNNISVLAFAGLGRSIHLRLTAYAINPSEGMITDDDAEPSIAFA